MRIGPNLELTSQPTSCPYSRVFVASETLNSAMEAALSDLRLHRPPRFLLRLQSTLLTSRSSTLLFKGKSLQLLSIKASSSTNFTDGLKPILRSACIASVAAAALLMAKFSYRSLLAIAAPITPLVMQKESDTGVSDEEKERKLEEYLTDHPDDVEALKSLMEVKIKSQKLREAVDVIDRLIQLQPEEKEWPLMKGQVFNYQEEYEFAKAQFEEVLVKDPLSVAAYHGLVMAVSEDKDELKKVLRRVEQAMEVCKKKRKEDVRDFKLLIAQIRVSEGNYDEALKVYQELVKEEPRDFRPYLCQGMIYTMLKKSDEAEKCFQKYKRLVPKAHPYVQFFDDNMIATKLFSEKVAREAASSKS